MEVLPTTTYSVSPGQLSNSPRQRSNDIVFLSTLMVDKDRALSETYKLANHFSDRTVYHKPKGAKEETQISTTSDLFQQPPENIELVTSGTYDLILNSRYAIASYSTVVIEAMQLGMMVWVIDDLPKDKQFYFREIPGLCVNSAEEIIKKIEAIEAGTETYPFEAMAPYFGAPAELASDTMRQKIGLEARGGYDHFEFPMILSIQPGSPIKEVRA